MKKNVGIYPGTFDPIHQGHISFALETLRACALDQVVFLPEPTPRGKDTVSAITDRIERTEQAIKGITGLSIFSPSSSQFTVRDTLPELRRKFGDAELTLLVGSDIVRTFQHRWQDLDLLLKDVSLAIGMRAEDTENDIVTIIKHLEKQYDIVIRYTLVTTPDNHRASSHVRNSSTLSSDILQQQFGETQLIILNQNTQYRVIETITTADKTVLELSLVTFDQANVHVFSDIHQAILAGESIGATYKKAGILFKRNVTAINHTLLPAIFAAYFNTQEAATVIEVGILVGPEQIHYCSILEIYSPAVRWPDPATSISISVQERLQEFAKLLEDL